MVRMFPRFGLGFFSAVLASMAFVSAPAVAEAADPNVLRICVGSASGNYAFAADEIGKRIGATFQKIGIIPTAGSKAALEGVSSGNCDMAFSQSDVLDNYLTDNPTALNTFVPFKTVYPEYAHLLCPVASGFEDVSDIAEGKGKIIVGPNGSGAAETWRSIVRSNPGLLEKNIERLPDAVDAVSLAKVKDSKNTCLLWVSGLNSPDMQAANRMSTNTVDRKPSLRLISIDDDIFENINGANGRPLYREQEINAVKATADNPGLYGNLIPSGFFSGGSVDVPVMDAVLVTTKAYVDAIGSKGGVIIQAIEDASPTIWKRTSPAS